MWFIENAHTHKQNEIPLVKKRKTSCEQKMVSSKLLGSFLFFFQDSEIPWGYPHGVKSLSLDPIYNHAPWHVLCLGEVPLLSYCMVTPVKGSVKSSISSPLSLNVPSTSWLKSRPRKFSENHQLQGWESHNSFRLAPKNKRVIQPKEMFTMLALRTFSEAKEKAPQKASETKKDPPDPGAVRKVPTMPGEVKNAHLY